MKKQSLATLVGFMSYFSGFLAYQAVDTATKTVSLTSQVVHSRSYITSYVERSALNMISYEFFPEFRTQEFLLQKRFSGKYLRVEDINCDGYPDIMVYQKNHFSKRDTFTDVAQMQTLSVFHDATIQLFSFNGFLMPKKPSLPLSRT